MGQSQSQKTSFGTLIAFLLLAGPALAQVNPFSVLGKVVTTSMDARTKSEVASDSEISADASRRLLRDAKSEWAGIALQKIRAIKSVKSDLRVVAAKT